MNNKGMKSLTGFMRCPKLKFLGEVQDGLKKATISDSFIGSESKVINEV